MSNLPDDKTFLSAKELARFIGRSEQTLANERHKNQGLPFIRFGRQIRYKMSDVIAAFDACRVVPREADNAK